MIRICSSTVQIKSLGDMYPMMTILVFSLFAITMFAKAILVLKRPLQKFWSVDFTGQLSSEMPMHTAQLVSDAKS